MTIDDRQPLGSVARSDAGNATPADLQQQIAAAVQAGASLEAIERDVIDRAMIDEEQRSALWLYAEAVIDRPGRLSGLDEDFVRAGSPPRA